MKSFFRSTAFVLALLTIAVHLLIPATYASANAASAAPGESAAETHLVVIPQSPDPLSLDYFAGQISASSFQTGTYERPLIVINSYNADVGSVHFGESFNVNIQLYNSGQHYAYNLVLSFATGDISPRETGGVISVDEIAPGNRTTVSQALVASNDLWGKATAMQNLTITYYDEQGTLYSAQFSLVFSISAPVYRAPTATPTATVAPLLRPQLVITQYSLDINPLEPGRQFTLQLNIQNLGNATAKRVTMVVGGGSASVNAEGTPVAGGTSGGSGDFTNFAPLGSSNIQSLGDVESGQTINASQTLIVNVSTNPGAYPMKISFVYTNEKGTPISDEQVITLLVYRLPKIDINFYHDPGPMFAGQPNMLPLQIVNLGRSSAVLGNMKVTATGGMVENSTSLVGTLETGGYFTLDSTLIPDAGGPLDLVITIDYTDDFNQPQTISKTLTLDIQEAPIIEPPSDGGPDGPIVEPTQPVDETFLQKAWRFFLGMIGLDSAVPSSNPQETPLSPEGPTPEESPVVPKG